MTVVGTRMKLVFLRYAAQANLHTEAISRYLWGFTSSQLMGECLDTISGNGELLPSNVSYKASTND